MVFGPRNERRRDMNGKFSRREFLEGAAAGVASF